GPKLIISAVFPDDRTHISGGYPPPSPIRAWPGNSANNRRKDYFCTPFGETPGGILFSDQDHGYTGQYYRSLLKDPQAIQAPYRLPDHLSATDPQTVAGNGPIHSLWPPLRLYLHAGPGKRFVSGLPGQGPH